MAIQAGDVWIIAIWVRLARPAHLKWGMCGAIAQHDAKSIPG